MKTKLLLSLAMLIFLFNASYAQVLILTAPDGLPVTISRDEFGVPHIFAENEEGLFFAQGFAAAQDRAYQLEVNRRIATGTISDVLGPDYLPLDRDVRTLFYTKEERWQMFKELPSVFKMMISSYTEGINAYKDSMDANPEEYRPQQFAFFEFNEWTEDDCLAIMHYLIRGFGQFGGEELQRLQDLQTNGLKWFEEHMPINWPEAPVTIKDGFRPVPRKYSYSGMTVSNELINSLKDEKKKIRLLEETLDIPEKFGSFAVLAGAEFSQSGNVMLLGGPQMSEPEQNTTNVVHEVELNCPTFHVGGMTVAGIPMVIIGRNDHHAWTMTSGVTDNIDMYIDSTDALDPSVYYHNSKWIPREVIVDTIYVMGVPTLYEHYRTIHGPVVAHDTLAQQMFSLKMTFWGKELDMMKAFYSMIKTDNLDEFELGVAMIPVSFNVFYIGKDQNMKYWHAGIYHNRGDNVDPRLPHKGDGSEEWVGFIPFEQLPQSSDPLGGYFANWNNKPVDWWNNGDNVPYVPESWVVNRVLQIEEYLSTAPGGQATLDFIMGVPEAIKSHGTYQQAIELGLTSSQNYNILPPGQSGFISLGGVPSPHLQDQWTLHENWDYKIMRYNFILTNAGNGNTNIASTFSLSQNYPNPFNPETTIGFSIPKMSNVRLIVYDVVGREVKTLINENMQAGSHKVKFNFSDMTSGVYFYKIQAGEFSAVKKMLLVK